PALPEALGYPRRQAPPDRGSRDESSLPTRGPGAGRWGHQSPPQTPAFTRDRPKTGCEDGVQSHFRGPEGRQECPARGNQGVGPDGPVGQGRTECERQPSAIWRAGVLFVSEGDTREVPKGVSSLTPHSSISFPGS